MANTYLRINFLFGSGITDDRRVKVSSDDSAAAFLESKIVSGSSKLDVTVLNPGGNELVEVDVNQTAIDHDMLLNYVPAEHAPLNDAATATTSLWSSQQITDYVAAQIATKDEAIEISYDNSASGLSAINVQDALDEVEGRLDTAEGDIFANTTSINNHISETSGAHASSAISYDNTLSTLTATDVKVALDQLDSLKFDSADFSSEFDSNFASKSSSDLSEGVNLYYTDERSQDAVGTILANTEILLTYDDATPQISANLDITGQVALNSSTVADGDELIIYDVDATAIRKITKSDFLEGSGNVTDGDIQETSAVLADNQGTPANISGFSFANAVTRSFIAQANIERGSNYELFEIQGIQKSTGWDISVTSIGDNTGVSFSIDSSGQVQYTSTSTGTAPTVKFRADALTVV